MCRVTAAELAQLDELRSAVDNRTLEIIEHRRRSHGVRRRGWLVRRALLAADLLGLCLAFAITEALFAPGSGRDTLNPWIEVLLFLVTLPLWVVVAKVYSLYDRDEDRADHSTADDVSSVLHLITIGTWLLFAGAYITRLAHPSVPKLLTFWCLAFVGVSGFRGVARSLCRLSDYYLQNTLIVGTGKVGQLIARKLLAHPEYGINLVGFIDAQPRHRADDLESLAVLGTCEDVPALATLLDVDRVVIAFSGEQHSQLLGLVKALSPLDVRIDIVPRLFEGVAPNVHVHLIEGLPLLGLPPVRLSRSSRLVKRALDLVAAALALLLLAPVLVLIAIIVKVDSRGPVLYRHPRVGRYAREIHVLKFRTMRLEACRGERYGGDDAERMFAELLSSSERRDEFEATFKLKDDPRITRIGRTLRRLSLDELPQLINVLRGDLSLVGPRAVTYEELARYGEGTDVLLAMRPGVTGFWQVNGRSRLSYADRVRLDLAYISGWSLGLDFNIVFKTLRTLVRPDAY
jgi:exopolysaccharide biosynthesis polyprenyl glycosylphosphotransferase